MQRYFLRYAYSGTAFTGSQKQLPRVPLSEQDAWYQWQDRNTVQGAIEQGLNYTLRPVYAANLITSSRTDTGVSATAATAALDLVHRHVDRGIYFDPRAITHSLNHYLESAELPIRILKTLAVRGSFYVQKVKSRRYVYRFLVENGKHPDILSEFSHSWSPRDSAKILIHGTSTGTSKRPRTTPIVAAWAKSLGFVEIRPPFDVDRFQSALSLFKGTHNFGSFTTGLALKNLFKTKGQDGVLAYIVRDVDDIQVHRMPMDAVEDLMPVAKCFDFYHVHINSTGFLHNQVRRMLGAAFRVAGHGIELSNIQQMLDEPSPGNFVNCKPMQAEGLHLTEINYDPDDLIGATDRFQDLPLSSPVGTPKVLQPIDWSSVSLLPPDRQQAQDIVNSETLAKERFREGRSNELLDQASGAKIGLESCQDQSEDGEWNSVGGGVSEGHRGDVQTSG
ncbi:uncharacterized protein LOC131881970 [Tigriopus californicus]|uniref:uncharacterized protein LOC131881970 n=1 Tax=Tigriopus californicus TaxID=6832 RepID=UPI0027DA08EE|nr:uncharacterized protein LOC131881970 [Tigriopus californicus]